MSYGFNGASYGFYGMSYGFDGARYGFYSTSYGFDGASYGFYGTSYGFPGASYGFYGGFVKMGLGAAVNMLKDLVSRCAGIQPHKWIRDDKDKKGQWLL